APDHRSPQVSAPLLLGNRREDYLCFRLSDRPGEAAFRVAEKVPASLPFRPSHSLLDECRHLLDSGGQTEFDWTSNKTRIKGLRVRLRGRHLCALQGCMPVEDCRRQRQSCRLAGLRLPRSRCSRKQTKESTER